MFKKYYQLTKPGIIYGNAITAMAGFFLASKGHISWTLFAAMLIGLSLVIASACVFNNYFDRVIDGKMQRTKNRALVNSEIKDHDAIIFAFILLLLGFLTLNNLTTSQALWTAMVGFFVYVFLYTPLKHKTMDATLVGAIAGATPPVVGYTAVTGRFDVAALILFLILVCWQMPHFYAIAIRRLEDYQTANIPVLPAVKGIKTTKIYMLGYCLLFLLACQALTVYGYTKIPYTIVVAVLGLVWLGLGVKGFKAKSQAAWAKQMFLWSLITITLLSLMLVFNFLYLRI